MRKPGDGNRCRKKVSSRTTKETLPDILEQFEGKYVNRSDPYGK